MKRILLAALLAIAAPAFGQTTALTTTGVQSVTGAKTFSKDKLCIAGDSSGAICFRTAAVAGSTPFDIGTGGTLGTAAFTATSAYEVPLTFAARLDRTSNTIDLATSGVSAGSYTSANITVDAYGRVTSAANGGGAAGTVTHTGGALTSNSVVLGAGTDDTKVVAGIITDGTSKLTLGVAGTSVGAVQLNNATSGSITHQPTTGALGTRTVTWLGLDGTGMVSNQTLTSGRIPVVTTNGVVTDSGDFTYSISSAQQTISNSTINGAIGLSLNSTQGGTSARSFLSLGGGTRSMVLTMPSNSYSGGSTYPQPNVANIYTDGKMVLIAGSNATSGNDLILQAGTLQTSTGTPESIRILAVGGTGSLQGNIAIKGANSGNPTARLHLPAGTATAGSAPLKIPSGTFLTTKETAAVEADNDSLYYTNTSGGGARYPMVMSLALFGGSTRVPFTTNDGVTNAFVLKDSSGFTYNDTSKTVTTRYFVSNTSTPTMGSCGSSPSVVGNDESMLVTVGTGGAATSCAVTFANSATNAPICVSNSDTDIVALKVVTTTTTVTVTAAAAFTAGSNLHILCRRR